MFYTHLSFHAAIKCEQFYTSKTESLFYTVGIQPFRLEIFPYANFTIRPIQVEQKSNLIHAYKEKLKKE